MTQTLLVIGGGALQCPALRFSREAGLRTVLVDEDPRAPGRKLAHEYHVLPFDDLPALVALGRGLEQQGSLVGVYTGEERGLRALAAVGDATALGAPAPEAVERALRRELAREVWQRHGLPVADGRTASGQQLVVQGLFRDGAFVPGGISERSFAPLLPGLPGISLSPAGLAAHARQDAHELTERAARALGIDTGPLEARLARRDEGLLLLELVPCFRDAVTAALVAPLCYGKSPIQAWLAALAGAGGPFDEMPVEPRAHAGWMSIAPERSGVLAGYEGLERARSAPGIAGLYVEEPGRELHALRGEDAVCGYLWGQAGTPLELEYRLRSARELLLVEVAWRRAA